MLEDNLSFGKMNCLLPFTLTLQTAISSVFAAYGAKKMQNEENIRLFIGDICEILLICRYGFIISLSYIILFILGYVI